MGLEEGESATSALQSGPETGVRTALGDDDEAADEVVGPETACGLLEPAAERRARLAGCLRRLQECRLSRQTHS